MPKTTTELRQDADQLLQEIRIVLPGTQTLMGFQFIACLNPIFLNLPESYKLLHFVALLFTIVCSLCLIAPVAFQQIGESGKPTKRFIKFTKYTLNIAMFILLISVIADLFVAARVIEINTNIALLISVLTFVTGLALWYGYAIARRKSRKRENGA